MQGKDVPMMKEWRIYDFMMQNSKSQMLETSHRFPINLRESMSKSTIAQQMENVILYFPHLVWRQLSEQAKMLVIKLKLGECESVVTPRDAQAAQELVMLGVLQIIDNAPDLPLAVCPRKFLDAYKKYLTV